uniref:Carnitine O-palmitoyltransferase n=1 Tax=Heterorhabditis bacteriophora TaxID=37862 RepID=A0A1I7XB84_HETBA
MGVTPRFNEIHPLHIEDSDGFNYAEMRHFLDDVETGGMNVKVNMGARKWRRLENGFILFSKFRVLNNFGKRWISIVIIFETINYVQVWNEFITKDEEEQRHILQNGNWNYEEAGGWFVVGGRNVSHKALKEGDGREHHPAYSSKACFERLDGRNKRLLLEKRLPWAFIDYIEDQLRSFFSTADKNSVFTGRFESSKERALIHAVAQYLMLSSKITHDGVSVSYDQELLRDIWHAFQRGYKRRIGRFKNNFVAGMFPANSLTFCVVIAAISIFSVFKRDLSFGIVPFIQHYVLYYIFGNLTFCYQGILHFISMSGPMLHSFQGALPHLPLPSLDETVERHLLSMKPILSEEEYKELEYLSEKFRKGVGRRLQRYLTLKSWLSTNYVTDWWEEFVYMRQRSPIMINSNYYGFDTLNEHPTDNQAARAANVTWSALQFRRQVERQEVTPFSISPRTKVPFCTMQYERLFNSCRVPGEER